MESTKLFKNDSSEVLVLPPNILEKLGINLRNIQSYGNETNSISASIGHPEDIYYVSDISAPDYISGKINDEECDGSSILETANLMKASVFLSPTFTNLKTTNGVNDLEFNNFDNAIASIQCSVSKPVKSPKRNGVLNISLERKTNSPKGIHNINDRGKLHDSNYEINIKSEEIIASEKIKELITSDIQDHYNLISVPINTINYKNFTYIKNSKASVQLSKENNNNECKDNNERSLNVLPFIDCEEVEYKIPIINNEIEDKSIKFKNNDGLKLSKEINMANKFSEDISINENHEENLSYENHSLLKNCDKYLKNKCEQQTEHVTSEDVLSSIDIRNENVDEEEASKCNNLPVPDIECDLAVIEIVDTEVPNHSETCVNEDQKNQYCDLETSTDETILNPGKDAKISKENLEICSRNKIINVNQNKVKSKLCIQGVEKPGGDDECENKRIYDKDLKTYFKRKQTKFSKHLFHDNKDCLKSNLDVEVNINLNVSSINGIYEKNSQKFCVCKDFGYFFYYDKDNEYQHIHYWKQRGAECSLDTLLSIYEENKIYDVNINEVDYNAIETDIENDMEDNNTDVLNICWMSVNSNIESEDVVEINEKSETQRISQTMESQSKTTEEIDKSTELDCQDVNRESQTDVSPKRSKLNSSVTTENKNKKRMFEDIDDNSNNELKSTNKFRRQSNRSYVRNNVTSDENIADESNQVNTLENTCSEKPYKNILKETKFVYGAKKRSTVNHTKTADDLEKNKSELSSAVNCVDMKANEHKIETKLIEETNKNNHNIAKKRKSSFPLSESSAEKAKKKKTEDVTENRNISCGLCKAKVYSSEWENHVRNHCFIAWEEGQKFNFNNELLCLQLKQHLNDNGKLVCVICDKVIKQVKKFLSHVEGCILYGRVEQSDDVKNDISRSAKHAVCGICKKQIPKGLWIEHIAKEHNYIAWKDGEKELDIGDEEAVSEHFNKLASDVKKFECKSCGIKRRCADSFLIHIRKCGKSNEEVTTEESSAVKDETSIVCGVCQNSMLANEWQNHIFKEHKYLAWKDGEQELDLNNTEEVYTHLYNLSKDVGGLQCSKCGRRRKYVNSYLKHIEHCDGEENPNCTLDSTMNESNVSMNKTLDDHNVSDDLDGTVRCGVCSKEIDRKKWENHIRKEHFYKAWQEGQEPVNLDDDEDVYNHLHAMSKKYKGLVCNNCGTNRKYVKTFLQHIQACSSKDALITDEVLNRETCKCGVCGEEVPTKLWKSHAMKKHYNVAWLDQQTPIDTNNGSAVEKYLKEYKHAYNKFVCNECGITRVSAVGFFAHVLQCGKTEEEIDKHRAVCDICNNKYLLIYKNQHITMHRDQENAKQRKLELQVEKEEKQKHRQRESDVLPGKRQAAERARTVIEKYKKQFKHNCPTCDYGVDSEEDLKKHTCSKSKYNFSDSEDSLQFSSDQESEDSDVNCELLDDELERPQKSNSKKKKQADPNPAAAFLPFPVRNTQAYLAESAEDFREQFLTSDVLYPQWRTCEYEVVPDQLLPNYTPTLEQSCQLQLQKEDWITLNKFESNNDQKWVSASFTGGCIQCVSWCPPHVSDAEDAQGHVLSAAVHLTQDAPRLPADTCHAHPAMLQIWDYGDMRTKPKFAFGIALDFGTIWSKDWCPSGTRDMLTDDPSSFKRLGLLSIACSNGSAYILSVPYPSTITDGEKKIFKLKPLAELRLTRGNRQKYQATAINWPAQKGHSTIVVGYSDGTIASYNLLCDSPLLTDTEDGVKIYYPYQDERTHNSCVTAVTSFPTTGASCPAGSSSATGGSRSACRGDGRGSRSAVTATSACFMPHWPDLLLAGNDAIVYQAPNVLSWVGSGRRLGSQQCCAGCPTCGRVALVAPPAVRLVTTHPVHQDLNKITVALLQMKPLVDKISKQKNDDLATKLEPVTYEDVIRKYGVELKLADDCDKSYLQQSNKPRDHYPERFPLSDVPAMAFNLSPKQHKKLAIATHCGFIFVLTV